MAGCPDVATLFTPVQTDKATQAQSRPYLALLIPPRPTRTVYAGKKQMEARHRLRGKHGLEVGYVAPFILNRCVSALGGSGLVTDAI